MDKNQKTVKLTTEQLRHLVKEELGKVMRKTEDVPKDVEEVEAGDFADTLALDIDKYKAMKIKESALQNALAKLTEQKLNLMNKIKKAHSKKKKPAKK